MQKAKGIFRLFRSSSNLSAGSVFENKINKRDVYLGASKNF